MPSKNSFIQDPAVVIGMLWEWTLDGKFVYILFKLLHDMTIGFMYKVFLQTEI